MARRQAGFGMIEVFITLLIVMIGLLGMAGLVGSSLTTQLEAYQRAQALNLVKSMVARINANLVNAAAYVTAGALGTGAPEQDCDGLTGQALDFCEWHNLLLGAAETDADGNSVGAMIGARGCIYQVAAPAAGLPARYEVAVAWQGITPTVAPPAGSCGAGEYGDDPSTTHRLLTFPVAIASLAAP